MLKSGAYTRFSTTTVFVCRNYYAFQDEIVILLMRLDEFYQNYDATRHKLRTMNSNI